MAPDDSGPTEETTAEAAPTGLRRIVFYSLLTSLCPLIPIPLLDDWVCDVLRRRLAAEHARDHGVQLKGRDLKILACGYNPPSVSGCVRGLIAFVVVKVVLKVLKKIFRKILVFLTVKDCVLAFSQTFHESYLARHALKIGALSELPPPVIRVRQAIEAAVDELDHRPIEELVRRTLRGSWRLVRAGARQLPRLLEPFRKRGTKEGDLLEADLGEEERLLGRVVDQLTAELEQEATYLSGLETLLVKHLGTHEEPSEA